MLPHPVARAPWCRLPGSCTKKLRQVRYERLYDTAGHARNLCRTLHANVVLYASIHIDLYTKQIVSVNIFERGPMFTPRLHWHLRMKWIKEWTCTVCTNRTTLTPLHQLSLLFVPCHPEGVLAQRVHALSCLGLVRDDWVLHSLTAKHILVVVSNKKEQYWMR